MSSIYGLQSELESLNARLKEAERENDESKVKYLEERISRVEKELQGMIDYNSHYNQ